MRQASQQTSEQKAVVLCYFLRRGDVSLVLSFRTRCELLQQMVPRYRQASASEKGALLNEIAAATGYTRRYAMWLLNHPHVRAVE